MFEALGGGGRVTQVWERKEEDSQLHPSLGEIGMCEVVFFSRMLFYVSV